MPSPPGPRPQGPSLLVPTRRLSRIHYNARLFASLPSERIAMATQPSPATPGERKDASGAPFSFVAMEHEIIGRWEALDIFRQSLANTRGQAALCVLRRPAVRDRVAASRAHLGVNPEGCGGALLDDEGAVRGPPLRLGLPRPSHRTGDRQEPRHVGGGGGGEVRRRRLQRPLPAPSSSAMSPSGARPSHVSVAGWTSTTTTRPWTPGTWSLSGGWCTSSGTRA